MGIMIHKELLKKKKKNHTNFRSKTKKNATHMEYTSDFYCYTSYYIVWPPPLLLGHYELKIGQKIIGNVFGSVRMLNYQQFFKNIFTQRKYTNIPKNNTENLAFS